MYTALYLPGHEIDSPTKDGFVAEEEAWDYIFSRMCKGCKEERNRVVNGIPCPYDDEWHIDSKYPACAEEWEVLRTSELEL